MDLYIEILAQVMEENTLDIVFPSLKISVQDIIDLKSYQALKKIKAIIEDDSLEDTECFLRIEEIVCLFEELGSSCGNRHDFG